MNKIKHTLLSCALLSALSVSVSAQTQEVDVSKLPYSDPYYSELPAYCGEYDKIMGFSKAKTHISDVIKLVENDEIALDKQYELLYTTSDFAFKGFRLAIDNMESLGKGINHLLQFDQCVTELNIRLDLQNSSTVFIRDPISRQAQRERNKNRTTLEATLQAISYNGFYANFFKASINKMDEMMKAMDGPS